MPGILPRWLTRLFFWRKKGPQGRRASWPTREEMMNLPPFQGLTLSDIVVVATAAEARRAVEDLMGRGVVGFDTESKPTFRKGEVSTGPHIAQFSTSDRAYVFMLHDLACRKAAGDLIASPKLKKVGFGLNEDLRQIRKKLDVEPGEVLDLENLFAEKGHGRGVGLKVGVAIAMKLRISKSKRATTSNWSLRRLTPQQLLYAANDAFGALRAYRALTD